VKVAVRGNGVTISDELDRSAQQGGGVDRDSRIAIVGAGIGGLVLALELHRVGFRPTIFEANKTISPLGVGINILPHASRVLCELGLEQVLSDVSIVTQESAFFNRFGQFIYAEPAGRAAGNAYPQFSIHRGDLQRVLLDAVVSRLGEAAVITGQKCTGVEDVDGMVRVHLESRDDDTNGTFDADLVVACDGVHSVIRKQYFPEEGEPKYSGVMMWRGVTVSRPFLTGATMARIGWLAGGKLVVYPIRNDVDAKGNQLINWVAEVETEQRADREWTREGRLEDFFDSFADRTFDWLDIPALIRGSESILEYPMVDQDPLPRWNFGRTTLLGDAAHPMVPRGSNGAGQAILDGTRLATLLSVSSSIEDALAAYEAERLSATAAVVEANRSMPPDVVLREVWERTGDRPFERIEDVISDDELVAISDRYRAVAGLLPLNRQDGGAAGATAT
jgi:2-polyprenyl-6-methoxyphenol hydroxylase-like FAD-dependent oxidoreductase